MDRISDQIATPDINEHSATDRTARRASAKKGTLGRYLVTAAPWAIIGGLLWAGLFIKPQPVGSTVHPPLLERRDHFYGLALTAKGDMLVAGSNGKILALPANGAQITRSATPGTHTLQDIAVWDAQHAIAVGNGGVILRSTDGGAQWSEVKDVPLSEIANKFNRVRVAPGGTAIVTGEMGALLISRDYGASWTRLRDEEDLAWNDVALIDESRLVTVGEFGRILRSEDGGETWSEVTSPVTSSLMSIAFRDSKHGVAVGLEGVVLTTDDGGSTWSQAELPVYDHLFDITWDTRNNRWIGAGALGRWIRADISASEWEAGRLDERDLSWHTRVVPDGEHVWFAGANVGRWDGERWTPIGN